MASALETVYAVLSVDAATTAIVSNRMGPLSRPQSLTVPALTYQRIVTTPTNHLRGDSGLDSNVVQIDLWTASYATSKSLAAAVRAALLAAKHVLTDERDEFDADVDPELYRIVQTWQIWTT